MFHVPTPFGGRAEHILSSVAFVLMLASWVIGYSIVCPAEPAAHRTHVAEVLR